MKHLKKILAIALVAMSLFAIALPALAALPPQPNIMCVYGNCPMYNKVQSGKFISAVSDGTYIQWTIRCLGCNEPYYPVTRA